MKKTILLIATAIAMLSCSALKGTSSQTTANNGAAATTAQTLASANNSTAMGAGQNAGTALLAMYNQFKADGNKYDYKNLNNILNTLQLVSACEGLKDNKGDKTYLKSFGKA